MKLLDRFEPGLLAILLAGVVGATQFRVLVSPDLATVENAEAAQLAKDPARDDDVNKLPGIPRAGVPVFDLQEPVAEGDVEPIGWGMESPHTSIRYQVMEPSTRGPAVEQED